MGPHAHLQERAARTSPSSPTARPCPSSSRTRPPSTGSARRPRSPRAFDVTAVLANDVLANAVGATIVPNDGTERMNVGAKNAAGVSALNPNGGTLVYNPREHRARERQDRRPPRPDRDDARPDRRPRRPQPGRHGLPPEREARPDAAGLPGHAEGRRAGGAASSCAPPPASAWSSPCATGCRRIAPDLAGYRHLPGIVTRDANAVGGTDHASTTT